MSTETLVTALSALGIVIALVIGLTAQSRSLRSDIKSSENALRREIQTVENTLRKEIKTTESALRRAIQDGDNMLRKENHAIIARLDSMNDRIDGLYARHPGTTSSALLTNVGQVHRKGR